MANYVLVHGSAHGSWCWERIVPLLQEEGHTVTAVDLPGNGHDDTPLAEVTLETYADYLCGWLDSQDGPSVLVGHSLGGISISRTAELRPDKVAVLVYLSAVLLGHIRMKYSSTFQDTLRFYSTWRLEIFR